MQLTFNCFYIYLHHLLCMLWKTFLDVYVVIAMQLIKIVNGYVIGYVLYYRETFSLY